MKKQLAMYTDNSIVTMEVSYETQKPVATGTDTNYSSVLSRLIQDTGRFCLHYASDLFIQWDTALSFLNQISVWGGGSNEIGFVFGIREYGVDDAGTVASNLEKGLHYYYRAFYVLETGRKNGTVYMELYKADGLKATSTKAADENTERKRESKLFDPVLTSLEELIQEYGEDGSFTIKGRGDISAAELLEELKKGSETGNIFRTMVTKTIVEYFMKFGS